MKLMLLIGKEREKERDVKCALFYFHFIHDISGVTLKVLEFLWESYIPRLLSIHMIPKTPGGSWSLLLIDSGSLMPAN